MSTTPEWHEDPTAPGSGRQRYWDGAQWTDWVMDPGATEARKYPVAEAQAEAAEAPTQQMPATEPMPATTPMPQAEPQAGPTPIADSTVPMPAAGAPTGGYAQVSPQPAKKSKAPLIIGIVVGVILLLGVGGVILAGLFVNKVSSDVNDALDDLAASASAELDDWESWAEEVEEGAEDLEEAFGDVTADPTISASIDAWFPDDDDPESVYLWLVDLWDTGMDDDTALEAGYWVCESYEGGAAESADSMNQLLEDVQDRYDLDEWGAAGVMSASTELCPEWTDALEEAWG